MTTDTRIEWVLRIGVAGAFIGHGVLAVKGNAEWVGWIEKITHVSHPTATTLLLFAGLFNLILAMSILVKPIRPLLMWMTFWGFLTAILRLLISLSVWDFIAVSANWAAPLALYLRVTALEKMQLAGRPPLGDGYIDTLIKKVK